jgi:hypothetical protein
MKIKALRAIRLGAITSRRDAEIEVSDQVGSDLVRRGVAVAVEGAPPPKKKPATPREPARRRKSAQAKPAAPADTGE